MALTHASSLLLHLGESQGFADTLGPHCRSLSALFDELTPPLLQKEPQLLSGNILLPQSTAPLNLSSRDLAAMNRMVPWGRCRSFVKDAGKIPESKHARAKVKGFGVLWSL